MKKIITKILIWEAKFLLKRFKPQIVGVTGSVGKSSAKEAITLVLQKKFEVRKSEKSYNSELGMALAILGLKTAWKNPLGWLVNIFAGFGLLFSNKFPEILVLEMGVDRPRDMEKLLKIVRPDVAVITAVGEVPVHVEFFSGPEDVAREKSKLIKAARSGTYAVLNFDDEIVRNMKKITNAEVITFGFAKEADVRASNYNIVNSGISAKINFKSSVVPLKVADAFGKQQIYAMLAAVAVGSAYGMNLIDTVEALSNYRPLPGRLRLLKGIKQSNVLDDTYNASPLASYAALDVLEGMKAGRKIIVLGDMLEIGKFAIPEHKAFGREAAKTVDFFVAVGPRAKFAAQEAKIAGGSKVKTESFSNSSEAGKFIKELINEGDLILVKGSQSMRMERVVEEIMAHPEEAPILLARQDKYWKNKK